MIVLYGLAYLYDSLFKKNWTGNFPSHERNHRPRVEYRPVKSKTANPPKKDTKKG